MLNVQRIFKVRSVAKTAALCIFTFGIFFIFRLVTLTREVNPHIRNPISNTFIAVAIVVHLLSYSTIAWYFATKGPGELLHFSLILHLLSSVFHITWLIKIRNRITSVANANQGGRLRLNPFLLAFLHIIYIQYKINQSVTDAKKLSKDKAVKTV